MKMSPFTLPTPLLPLLVPLLLVPLTGCESRHDETDPLDRLTQELSQTIDEGKRLVDQLKPQAEGLSTQATDEIEKLFVYEYRVEEVPRSVSRAELSQLLNSLGNDRWDCYSILPTEDNIRITCKRRPKSYLRYIPRWFPDI